MSSVGNVGGATAKILPACKTVFVGNQLDLTKESLEVCGNTYPRYMIVMSVAARLAQQNPAYRCDERAKRKSFAFSFPSEEPRLRLCRSFNAREKTRKGLFSCMVFLKAGKCCRLLGAENAVTEPY